MSERRETGSAILAALRSRISGGTYPPGSRPPPQRQLAEDYGVSRDTIQRALRELESEGWIETRQGSGSQVRATLPVHVATQPRVPSGRTGLGPFVRRAFECRIVELDVFTLTSESLDAHIRVQAEAIRTGQIPTPDRIALRLLVPSGTVELPYPRARAPKDRSDAEVKELDRILQARTREIIRRHTSSLRDALRSLRTDGLVPDVEVAVREVPLVPTHKLYLRRGVEGLLGPYEVVERTILTDDGTEIDACDVLGPGSALTELAHDEGTPDATGSVLLRTWQEWFDSAWLLLAT
ncbi:GntR family transcriptional regulator [Streptomyces caeruleatus]